MTLALPELGATVTFVRNPRARRYVLRVASNSELRCTVPRRGNLVDAARFIETSKDWITKQLAKRRAAPPSPPRHWHNGHEILFRGATVRLEFSDDDGVVRFADQIIPHRAADEDLRPLVERRLRLLATREFPPRVLELAAQHGLCVQRVSVRAQRSRWGSCSHSGTISLNWRLIHAPDFVRDYVIVHELMHIRQMNHSDRFWDEVARAFPNWREAEAWLKRHGPLIR